MWFMVKKITRYDSHIEKLPREHKVKKIRYQIVMPNMK